ncbi:A1pp-domain-containing protein [Lepidopterella palustris CBS 459.81]|uniref:A1pp-domain-containing protein n=1 Tax=Lepidopterella palustris CBS 459.81 TaxID=1314670 RepID=A0A8E2ELD0_9PEZI|nr:A1pp-domain-containing protein [Lepidopterella palustris CBS 459.81]
MERPEPLPLSEIPTITLLYKLKHLVADEDADPATLPTPSSIFNDKISVIRHDITLLEVDSIVNAANESLLGGGGVDGAIHRAAGPDLFDECEELGGCATGFAKITNGYELPVKKVIHAVGPVYWFTKKDGMAGQLLSGCYRRSLELAVENGLQSIAFSALSTGAYGYPSDEAAQCALETVRKFMEEGQADSLERIIFCNFMEKDQLAYYQNIPKYFPPVVPENGEAKEIGKEADIELPDVPTSEPVEDGQPEAKKQKVTEATDESAPLPEPKLATEETTKPAEKTEKPAELSTAAEATAKETTEKVEELKEAEEKPKVDP